MGCRTQGLVMIAVAVALGACGGKSSRVGRSDSGPPEITSFPPVGCTEESAERTSVAARVGTLAKGRDLRVESVDGQTGRVAYTVAEGTEHRSLYVVSATPGEAPQLLATGLRRVPDMAELVIRFEGSALLVMTNVLNDVAEQLSVWRPDDTGPTFVAFDVDPTAVRASRDGRFLSVEADDRRRDMKQTVSLLLVDLRSMEITLLGDIDQPRARFTRDSSALVFSGVAGRPAVTTVQRIALDDRSITQVASVSPLVRWELTPDAAWLVHGQETSDASFQCPLFLAQSSLKEPLTVVPDDRCLLPTSGKELDIADDGGRLAFLSRPADPTLAGAALRVRGLNGEDPAELVPGDVVGIVDHFDDVIAYRSVPESECGDEHLMSIPSAGGTAWDLGPFTNNCPTELPVVAPVLDEKGGALLALAPDGTLRFQPAPEEEPLRLGCRVDGAGLANRRTAIFSAPYQGGRALFRYDHDSGAVGVLEREVTGPFLLSPGDDNWLAVTVPDPEGGALVRDTE